MKFLGKFLAIKKIQLHFINKPPGWQQLLAEPRVRELADSIKAHGMIGFPIIRERGHVIVAGRDRVAAHALLNADYIQVRMWQGTDAEAKVLELEENIRRKHLSADDRDAMLRELLEMQQEPPAEYSRSPTGNIPARRRRGRPAGKTPKVRAREAVAKAANVSPDRVYRAEKAAEPTTPTPQPPCIETFGIPIPPELEAECRTIIEGLNRAEQKLKEVQAVFSTLQADYPAVPQELKRLSHELADKVRTAKPEMVCPYCKAVPDVRAGCKNCHSIGYLLLSEVIDIPPEYLLTGDEAGIRVDDTFCKLSDLSRPKVVS